MPEMEEKITQILVLKKHAFNKKRAFQQTQTKTPYNGYPM